MRHPSPSTLSVVCAFTQFCIVAAANAAADPVQVSNHKSGSTVRYSVVLLRGTFAQGATQIEITNANATAGALPPKPALGEGRFKALVELSEGLNIVELRTDVSKAPLKLEITYAPQTNPYYVRLVWMTDNSGDITFAAPNGDVPQDYANRLRTAALLMQTFTAERMHDLGFGRHTFRLERNSDGEVIVHTLKAPESADHYYALGDNNRYWGAVGRWLNATHPDPFAKNIVLAAFTRKDPDSGKMRGHTALGGGNLGLFGSASVFSWPRHIADAVNVFHDNAKVDPTRVHDDSAGRGTYWALASTTIGATLHEMGHTFGLPHCTDGRGIMTRGFDQFNRVFTLHDPPSRRGLRGKQFTPEEEAYFAPVSASYLKRSRWFRLDEIEYPSDSPPRIAVDRKQGTVTITSEAGIPWVGLWVGPDIHAFREFENLRKIELSFDEIRKLLGGKAPSKLTTIASNGKSASANLQRSR